MLAPGIWAWIGHAGLLHWQVNLTTQNYTILIIHYYIHLSRFQSIRYAYIIGCSIESLHTSLWWISLLADAPMSNTWAWSNTLCGITALRSGSLLVCHLSDIFRGQLNILVICSWSKCTSHCFSYYILNTSIENCIICISFLSLYWYLDFMIIVSLVHGEVILQELTLVLLAC